MRGAGLVAGVVVSVGLWLYGHGHGSAPAGTTPAYCRDVSSLVQTLGDAKSGSIDAARLERLSGRFQADAAALTSSGDATEAATASTLASDVQGWGQAVAANDAVDQTIALDRTLSDASSAQAC